MSKNLVYGVGVRTKGERKAYENGKTTKACHAWLNMLRRCYSPSYQERYPTYIGCSVCDEWLCFQSFAEWYEENYPKDGNNYQIDKDLKALGNKVYSPSTCLFVSRSVNLFTTDSGATRGNFMIGVCWHKTSEKFESRCCNPLTKKARTSRLLHRRTICSPSLA